MTSNGSSHEPPERYYRAEGGSTQATGGSVYQINAISTPVLVVLIVALALIGAISGAAVALSYHAAYVATIAEREARLAQRRYDDLRVEFEIMRGKEEQQ